MIKPDAAQHFGKILELIQDAGFVIGSVPLRSCLRDLHYPVSNLLSKSRTSSREVILLQNSTHPATIVASSICCDCSVCNSAKAVNA